MGRPRKNPNLPPPTPQTLGDRLRAERTRLGFTQAQLAQELGVAERAVQNYEQDRNAIRMAILERLGLLGFDVDYLIFGDDLTEGERDTELWERVSAWADENCVGAYSHPLDLALRHQRIAQVYRFLKNAKMSEEEVEERLQRMSRSRAA